MIYFYFYCFCELAIGRAQHQRGSTCTVWGARWNVLEAAITWSPEHDPVALGKMPGDAKRHLLQLEQESARVSHHVNNI